MTEITIFEDYKTHEQLLSINYWYDTNTPSKTISIGTTLYYIIGWNDKINSGGTTITRYIQISNEVFK